MRRPPKPVGLRGGPVVTALIAIVGVAAVAIALSQQSRIGDLTSKNSSLASGKAQAIRQRNAAQQALDQRAAQMAADEEEAQKIEALRPPGATLFAANCASCHGRDGEGHIGPQLSDGTVARQLTEAQAVAFVSKGGTPPMPNFAAVLSPEQITQIVEYLLKL